VSRPLECGVRTDPNGTLAHAIERCDGISARVAALQLASAANICGQAKLPLGIGYEHASSS